MIKYHKFYRLLWYYSVMVRLVVVTSGSGGTGCNRDCHSVVVQVMVVTSGGTHRGGKVVLGAIETVIVWWYR